jgi:hypothetical protein
MARFVSIQTNFSTGEIDPLLRARVDLPAYANALEEATNVVVQPQGGVRRRPGLRYISSLPNSGDESAANGVRLVPFEFSTSDSYMLCFTHERMAVFKAGVLITDINASGDDFLDTSALGLTGARLANLVWTQSADTLIAVQQDIPPVKIVRGATDSDWTGSVITFDSTPKYVFSATFTNPAGTLTPSAVSGKVNLTGSASVFHSGQTGTAQAGTSTTITLDSGASATDDIYNGSTITITGGTGVGQIRVISDYVGATKVATVSVAWTVTPDNTSIFSVTSQVGQYINASPQGRAKIVAITSATVAQAITEFPFFNTSAIANNLWELETGYEEVWSTTRGFPRSVTFHEGRLYFGGSRARPSTIWGSKVGLFFDFEATEALDDDAVEATLDTNTFNAITDIQAGRDLQVFTTGGEFYCPQEGLQPITPDNFFVKSTTRNGSQEGIRVQQLESGTLFVQRQGKSLNEFAFTDVQLTYVTSKISLLSGHLLRGPTRMALRRSVATDENDLLLLVNGTDGSMVAFSLLRAQNVIAPSEFTTDGEFEDVGVDLTTIYVVVKRTVDAATVFYVERFDDTLTTDSAVTGGAAATGSAAHLVAKSVDILLDGSVQANQTVPGGGTVTFPRSSTSSFQIGLDYAVKVVTMPADLKISAGTRLGFKKRIVEVNVFVKDTQHLIINGTNVPFRSLDDPALLDEEVGEFTGTKTLPGVLGYSNEGKITIEQDIPLKMILLGLEYKISTYPGT